MKKITKISARSPIIFDRLLDLFRVSPDWEEINFIPYSGGCSVLFKYNNLYSINIILPSIYMMHYSDKLIITETDYSGTIEEIEKFVIGKE